MEEKMQKRWLKTVIIVVVIAAVIYLIRQNSHRVREEVVKPVGLSLSPPEINAAVNYGRSHRNDLLVDFEKPWTVFLGYKVGKGNATIFTIYHCLALIARNSSKEDSRLDTENLYRLCAENEKNLYFEVILYGDEEKFDSDYTAVVLKDDREIPALKTVHLGYDESREYILAAKRRLYFPADILLDKGKITLRIVRPEDSSLDFVFDLNEIP